MIKFIRLLEFELGRFLRFLIPAIVLSAVIQFIALFDTITNYNAYLKESLESNVPMQQFSMHDVTGSGLFPVAILIVPLLFVFYSLFTWYREWLGKNTFIYRLLMLPINRMSIFFSKAITFLIGGLLAFLTQFGLYAIIFVIFENAIQPEYFTALNIHNVQPPYEMIQLTLFPTTSFEFLHIYGFAFAALLALFTAILMERSFSVKGAIGGIIYFIAYFVGYFYISALNSIDSMPWIIKPSHIFLMQGAYVLLMMVISALISHLLLKNKVRV